MEQENSLIPEENTNTPEISENKVADKEESLSEGQRIEVTKEHKEIPNINFIGLTTHEILRQVERLIAEYPLGVLREIMEEVPEIFDIQYKKEYEEALVAFTANGDQPENFSYKNDNKEQFHATCKLYKEKKAEANKQIEAEREANLKTKLNIIEELKKLIQEEESLDKTFPKFRELQERWRNTGPVPQAQLNGLLETYHLHVENFYNYIKINNELRDLDLKRNLDAKTGLCEQAEKLIENNDITTAFKQLQTLHSQWKEIGPIPKEQKETLWERFKQATGQINEKYHNFFETLRQEQENNLIIKEELCSKAAALAAETYNTMAEWGKAIQTIVELQEEWKHSGTVPQKDRNKIYKKFRTACDLFFERKREATKQIATDQTKNLQLKIELCEKVEAIKDSTDWAATANKIINYQKEWKKIGAAPQKYSNKVWTRFRSACDHFFNNKQAHFQSIDQEQTKNLELKQILLEEVKQFTLSGNTEEDINKLKEYQSRWMEIGFVPIKAKGALQEEFRKVLNGYFNLLNLDEFDRDLERFRAKLTTIDAGENKEYKIINEREKLIGKIRQLETDIHTWENNVGFISKSKKSQGLIDEMMSKIENTKQRLTLLQEKLKSLDDLI